MTHTCFERSILHPIEQLTHTRRSDGNLESDGVMVRDKIRLICNKKISVTLQVSSRVVTTHETSSEMGPLLVSRPTSITTQSMYWYCTTVSIIFHVTISFFSICISLTIDRSKYTVVVEQWLPKWYDQMKSFSFLFPGFFLFFENFPPPSFLVHYDPKVWRLICYQLLINETSESSKYQ